ncbi:hypothetical protein B0O80DRAFT_423747 [Mortierella sp. GBAus27b]|nr:hypothetical protein B0O80DRAFT_423747 [Mortierella sp. GBAus27b]
MGVSVTTQFIALALRGSPAGPNPPYSNQIQRERARFCNLDSTMEWPINAGHQGLVSDLLDLACESILLVALSDGCSPYSDPGKGSEKEQFDLPIEHFSSFTNVHGPG